MSQATRPSPGVLAGIVAGAVGLSVLVFSSRRPSADVRDWSPTDHDQPAGQQPTQGAMPRQKAAPQEDAAALVDLAWSRNCATCHGAEGRGDGPQGPMVRAPDLTRADWQGRITDDDIKQTIRNGRNSMPKFDLPDGVVDGLVKRIRTHRPR
jgi:cytochrome c oxidase cbb3-type subunit 3